VVNFLSLFFALFLSVNSFAAVQPSGVPTKTLGGVDEYPGSITVSSTDVSYFTISATVLSSATGNFYPFYKNGTQYQVTTGKTARCEQINIIVGANTNLALQLVSSQTVYAQNAGSITSGTYQGGAVGIYAMNTSGTANKPRVLQNIYEFIALSYPGIQVGNSTQQYMVYLTCREI
jgi:hypothetical protein